MVGMTTRSKAILPVYAVAEGFSFLGNSVIQVVLPWLVLVRTGNPAAAAGVAAATGIAQIAATVAVGQLIDRFGARRMAVIADVFSAASVAALAIVDSTSNISLAAIVVLAAAGGLFDIPGMTARQTLIPRLAERAGVSVDTTAGLRQGIFGLSFLTGPAVAGLLLATLSPGQVLWLTAGCSALAALATLAIKVPAVAADASEVGMRGAWGTVRRSPIVVKLLIVMAMSSIVSAPLTSVLIPTHFAEMDRPALLGAAMSGFAVGIVAGSGLYAALAKISRRLAWTLAIAGSTVGLVLIATLDGFWIVAAGTAIVGLGSGVVSPLIVVVIAERIPNSQLGRVMGLANAVSLVAGPLGLGVASLIVTGGDVRALGWSIVVAWTLMSVFALVGRSLTDLESPNTDSPTDNGTYETQEESADADDRPAR